MSSDFRKELTQVDKHLERLSLLEKLQEATQAVDVAKGVCEATAWSDDKATKYYCLCIDKAIRLSREIDNSITGN